MPPEIKLFKIPVFPGCQVLTISGKSLILTYSPCLLSSLGAMDNSRWCQVIFHLVTITHIVCVHYCTHLPNFGFTQPARNVSTPVFPGCQVLSSTNALDLIYCPNITESAKARTAYVLSPYSGAVYNKYSPEIKICILLRRLQLSVRLKTL